MTKVGRAARAGKRRATLKAQPAEPRLTHAEALIAFALAAEVPLDGGTNEASALLGLDRIEAYCRMARLDLADDLADAPNARAAGVRVTVARLNALLSNLHRTDDGGAHGDADVRNAVICLFLDSIDGAKKDPGAGDPERIVDTAVRDGLAHAEQFAPSYARRLQAKRDAVVKALHDYRVGSSGKAILALSNVLGTKIADTTTAQSDAAKMLKRWRKRRQARLSP